VGFASDEEPCFGGIHHFGPFASSRGDRQNTMMTTEEIHTYCPMCIAQCGVVAVVEDGRFTKVRPDPEHPNGGICVKGSAAPEMVYSPDRLLAPMKRTAQGRSEPRMDSGLLQRLRICLTGISRNSTSRAGASIWGESFDRGSMASSVCTGCTVSLFIRYMSIP
jgi:hypothetical protein